MNLRFELRHAMSAHPRRSALEDPAPVDVAHRIGAVAHLPRGEGIAAAAAERRVQIPISLRSWVPRGKDP